jgi:hypothetical protein
MFRQTQITGSANVYVHGKIADSRRGIGYELPFKDAYGVDNRWT